jgi:hypothetical protein
MMGMHAHFEARPDEAVRVSRLIVSHNCLYVSCLLVQKKAQETDYVYEFSSGDDEDSNVRHKYPNSSIYCGVHDLAHLP